MRATLCLVILGLMQSVAISETIYRGVDWSTSDIQVVDTFHAEGFIWTVDGTDSDTDWTYTDSSLRFEFEMEEVEIIDLDAAYNSIFELKIEEQDLFNYKYFSPWIRDVHELQETYKWWLHIQTFEEFWEEWINETMAPPQMPLKVTQIYWGGQWITVYTY